MWHRVVATCLFLAALCLGNGASAIEIGRFDVSILLGQDSTFVVTESIEIDFGDQRKHGIFRTIPGVGLLTATDSRRFPRRRSPLSLLPAFRQLLGPHLQGTFFRHHQTPGPHQQTGRRLPPNAAASWGPSRLVGSQETLSARPAMPLGPRARASTGSQQSHYRSRQQARSHRLGRLETRHRVSISTKGRLKLLLRKDCSGMKPNDGQPVRSARGNADNTHRLKGSIATIGTPRADIHHGPERQATPF